MRDTVGIPPDRPQIQHRHGNLFFMSVGNVRRQRTDNWPINDHRQHAIKDETSPATKAIVVHRYFIRKFICKHVPFLARQSIIIRAIEKGTAVAQTRCDQQTYANRLAETRIDGNLDKVDDIEQGVDLYVMEGRVFNADEFLVSFEANMVRRGCGRIVEPDVERRERGTTSIRKEPTQNPCFGS